MSGDAIDVVAVDGGFEKPDNSAKAKTSAILWLPVACPSCGNNQATPPMLAGETRPDFIARMRLPMDLSCYNCLQPLTAVFVEDCPKG